MKTKRVEIGREINMGDGQPAVLVAGPCVIESRDHLLRVCEATKRCAGEVQIPYVLKNNQAVVAGVHCLGSRGHKECNEELDLGGRLQKRYSKEAITRIKATLKKASADSIVAKSKGKDTNAETRSCMEGGS